MTLQKMNKSILTIKKNLLIQTIASNKKSINTDEKMNKETSMKKALSRIDI
jgi:hypothetical protein